MRLCPSALAIAARYDAIIGRQAHGLTVSRYQTNQLHGTKAGKARALQAHLGRCRKCVA